MIQRSRRRGSAALPHFGRADLLVRSNEYSDDLDLSGFSAERINRLR